MAWGSWNDRWGSGTRSYQNRNSSRSGSSSRQGAPTGLTPGSVLSTSGGSYSNPRYQEYWGYAVQDPNTGRPVGAHAFGTPAGYNAYRQGYGAGLGMGAQPAAPAYSGGGGGGYGGGGGGGGGGAAAPAMNQAMLDQMLQLLGMQPQQLALQQTNLPGFRGQNIPAFNPAPYQQLTGQLGRAVTRDQAAAAAAAAQATKALQRGYSNAYANANVTRAPAAQQVGAGLQETAGGGGNQAGVAAESNAAAAGDQASFQNLLGVLAAADRSAQTSRLSQVQMDRQAAMRQIGAANLGLGAQIGMARTQAHEQWRQEDAARRYQNNLMAQQWQREEMMRNQDLANQQQTANWQSGQETMQSRIQPLLDLILQAGMVPGLNLSGVTNLVNQWGQAA